jgi:hypothetical protein
MDIKNTHFALSKLKLSGIARIGLRLFWHSPHAAEFIIAGQEKTCKTRAAHAIHYKLTADRAV